MAHSGKELPEQLYRRIYRLHHQKVDLRLIAAALNIPIMTVQNVIERLGGEVAPHHKGKPATADHGTNSKAKHLDQLVAFTFNKIRFAVVDVAGPLTGENSLILAKELKTVMDLEFKAASINLSEVSDLDQEGIKTILDFQSEYVSRGRYVALLDPSPEIESVIASSHLDDKIPIFGTERAFEEAAFVLEIENKSRKSATQRR